MTRRRKKENRFFPLILVFFFLIISGFLLLSSWRVRYKRTELQRRLEFLQEEVARLKEEKQQLETGISQTQEESYWEARIREQGYQKPGETAVVIKTEGNPPSQEQAPANNFWHDFFQEIQGIFSR